MKKITLLLTLVCAVTLMNAQDIIWLQGASDTDRTVEVGDTVRWVWGNASTHDINSTDPDAPADFGVGLTQGQGFIYEYTFTEVGVIDYFCTPHLNNMTGTITVVEPLSITDNFTVNVRYFPNPVTEKMTLTSLYEIDSFEIFNILGKKVMTGVANGKTTEIDMNQLTSGMYLITAKSGDLTTTFKVIKK